MKLTYFLFFSLIIIYVCQGQYEKLEKYSTLTANDNYIVFDSSGFGVGESMYFKITTEEHCADFFYYKYYDNIELIIREKLQYYVKYHSSESTSVNGRTNKMVREFTIEKKQTEIGGDIKGNYLLLNYDCNSQYEIENTQTGSEMSMTTIIIITCSFVAVVAIISFIYYCYCRRVRQQMAVSSSYVVPYGSSYYQQGMYPNPMMYQNPPPQFLANPATVQIAQNGAIPNSQLSSQRGINPKEIKEPKIDNN